MSDAATTSIHPSLRSRHGLGEQERGILTRTEYAVLGTFNDDGTLHLAPVMFLLDGERILIETGSATRKARNIAARPTASLLVQTPDAAWAYGTGPAAITTGSEAASLNERVQAKYLTREGLAACGSLLSELDDVTVVVTPTRWLGWDIGGMLDTLAERGVDLSQVETWFRSDSAV